MARLTPFNDLLFTKNFKGYIWPQIMIITI